MRGEGIRETKEKISKLRPDNDLLTNLLLTVTCAKRLDRVPPSANQPYNSHQINHLQLMPNLSLGTLALYRHQRQPDIQDIVGPRRVSWCRFSSAQFRSSSDYITGSETHK
jgi:hypothetical protein